VQYFITFFWNADSVRVVTSSSGSGQSYRVHYLHFEATFYRALQSKSADVVYQMSS